VSKPTSQTKSLPVSRAVPARRKEEIDFYNHNGDDKKKGRHAHGQHAGQQKRQAYARVKARTVKDNILPRFVKNDGTGRLLVIMNNTATLFI